MSVQSRNEERREEIEVISHENTELRDAHKVALSSATKIVALGNTADSIEAFKEVYAIDDERDERRLNYEKAI